MKGLMRNYTTILRQMMLARCTIVELCKYVYKPSTNPPHHPNTPFASPLQKRLARETKELEKLEKTFSQAGSKLNV